MLEKFTYNKKLNDIFYTDDVFNNKYRIKLLGIAKDFISNYKEYVSNDRIVDIILTGSLANYNYTEYSDLDVHIIVDFKKSDIFLKKYLDNEAKIWNSKHDITIKGFDVEIYIQDSDEIHIASGVYSLLNNKWNIKPIYSQPEIDEDLLNKKVASYKNQINKISANVKDSMDENDIELYYNKLDKLKDKIIKNRKVSLKDDGEYSLGNLIFKELRNSNYVEKIIKLMNKLYDMKYVQ